MAIAFVVLVIGPIDTPTYVVLVGFTEGRQKYHSFKNGTKYVERKVEFKNRKNRGYIISAIKCKKARNYFLTSIGY